MGSLSHEVMVVSGETSGDRLAASIARALAAMGLRTFGLGGALSARAGVELIDGIEDVTAMGTLSVAARIPRILAVYFRLLRAAATRQPAAAVLVDFTEFNQR